MIGNKEHRELLSADKFDEIFQNAHQRIFRVESLPEYNVPADRAIYDSYARGVPLPPISSGHIKTWLEMIKGMTERGIRIQRLRLIPEKITPYLRYEIDWAYTFSKDFGEEARFLSLKTTVRSIQEDFYVFDDSKLIYIEYDQNNNWVGFSTESNMDCTAQLIFDSSAAWNSAKTLEEFLVSYRNQTMEIL